MIDRGERHVSRNRRARETGFTLIEVMITVAIIAILAAIAYPVYLNQVQQARRSDGQTTLIEVMQAEERFYTLNNTYTTALQSVLGFAADPVASEEGWYAVSAAACGGGGASPQCVQLTATPQGAQATDPCGNISLNSRGQWSRSGSAAATECY